MVRDLPAGPDPRSKLEEFWLPRTGIRPDRDASGSLTCGPDTAIVMVLIPGGSAIVGADGAESAKSEQPRHSVVLAPFLIGKFEITQGHWSRLSGGSNPSRYGPREHESFTLDHPVETVAWSEAKRLLHKIGLDLPTEAQWEHACRSGRGSAWFFGDRREDALGADGRGLFNAADGFHSRAASGAFVEDAEFWPRYDDGHVVHSPVGSFPPNDFGCHDMHGNIAELTRDDWGSYKNLSHAPGDGALIGGDPTRATNRGGSWYRRVEAARCSARKPVDKSAKFDNVGLRAVRDF